MPIRSLPKLVSFLTVCAFAAAPTGYHLVGKYPVGGDAGWDYITVDSEAQKLYVAHLTRIEVLDAASGKKAGAVTGTDGVHGIALVPALGKGFTSNGKSNTVSVIDLKTLKHTAEIKAGKKPDAIVYDEGTKQVIVSNGESDNLTIIDAASNKVAGTVAVGGAPEYIASDLKGTIWVNLEDKDAFVTVDIKAMKLVKTTPISGCTAPAALAIDVATRTLYIGCKNKKAAVVQADSGKVLALLSIGERADGAGFDPSTGRGFISCGDGHLIIIGQNGGKYEVIETVTTARGAKTMVFDPKTSKIYMPTVEGVPDTATGPPTPTGPGMYKPGEFEVIVVAK